MGTRSTFDQRPRESKLVSNERMGLTFYAWLTPFIETKKMRATRIGSDR